MSHWNYRVVKTKDPLLKMESFSIYEVYYRDDGGIEFLSGDLVPLIGESLKDLKDVLDMMKKALDEPVLERQMLEEQFEFAFHNDRQFE